MFSDNGLKSHARNAMLVVGTGCVLFVLSMSVEGKIAVIYPYVPPEVVVYSLTLFLSAILLTSVIVFYRRGNLISLYKMIKGGALALICCWAATMLWMLTNSWWQSGASRSLFFLLEVSRLLLTALLGLLWNVQMVLSKPSDIPWIGAATMLFAACLYAATLFVPEATTMLAVFASVISYTLVFLLDATFSMKPDGCFSMNCVKQRIEREPLPTKSVAVNRLAYFGTRVLWHAVTTIVLVMSTLFDPVSISKEKALLIFCLLIGLCVGVCLLKKSKISACFAAAGSSLALFALFELAYGSVSLMNGEIAFVTMTVFSWYMLFYIQLPAYVNLTRMDPLFFALLELSIPLAFAYGLRVMLALLSPSLEEAVIGNPKIHLAIICFVVASIALSVLILLRHLIRYYPSVKKEDMAYASDQSSKSIESVASLVAKISVKYGLTSREQDVLYYLSLGYSRPYISKALCVSLTTIKTHASSIYRKMGVSNHDALIDAVLSAAKEKQHDFLA